MFRFLLVFLLVSPAAHAERFYCEFYDIVTVHTWGEFDLKKEKMLSPINITIEGVFRQIPLDLIQKPRIADKSHSFKFYLRAKDDEKVVYRLKAKDEKARLTLKRFGITLKNKRGRCRWMN